MKLGNQGNNRRRNYLIDKKFQGEFILGFLVVIIAFIVMIDVVGGIYYYIKYQLGEAIFHNYLLIIKKGEPIKVTNMYKIMLPILFYSGIVFVVVIGIYGIFYSHRISGPIYRVKKAMEAIAKGKLDFQVRLRKKDKFQELTGYINNVVSSLGGKISSVKDSAAQINSEINALSRNLSDKKKAKASISIIKKQITQLQKGLNTIKVKSVKK